MSTEVTFSLMDSPSETLSGFQYMRDFTHLFSPQTVAFTHSELIKAFKWKIE